MTTLYKSSDDQFLYQSRYLPNPGLHGEKITESDIGFDLGILSKIMISFDFFSRYTHDGIIQWSVSVPTLPEQGFIENDTRIRNRGWELLLNAQLVESANLQWMLNFNFTRTNSSLLSANRLLEPKVGDDVGSIYGFKFAGFSEKGRELSYDENGNITEYPANRQVIGNVLPKSYLGLTNNLIYRNFDLSFSLRGAMDFSIRNLNRYQTTDLYNSMGNFPKDIRTIDTRAIGNSNLAYFYDYFLEKGGGIKVDNISLGYNLKSKGKYITSSRFYFACNNVHTFTRFTGWDPEMAGITGTSAGVYSYNPYPVTRIFVIGLKILI